jgi:predicted nucleic-acid-binding protein
VRAIDTNVLVRLLIQDDSGQVHAAEAFIQKGAWVSTLALAEAMWVLGTVYSQSPKAIATAVSMLLDHKQLVIQDADAVASALENFRAKPALGFSDCLILEIARKSGHLPLGTFDRGLAKLDVAQKV